MESTVIKSWQDTAPSRNIMKIFTINSPKEPLIHLTVIYVLEDGETFKEAQRKIRSELASLKGNLTIHEPRSYSEVQNRFANERVYHSFSVGRTILTKYLCPIDILINRIELANKLNGFAYIGLQLMGG